MRYEGRGDEYDRTRQRLSPSELVRVRNQLAQNLSGQVTTPQITSDQNNYPIPTGATLLRIDVDSTARTFTGLAGGSPSRVVTLSNVGLANILLAHESASSVAVNRLQLPTPLGVVIAPGQTATLIWDLTTQRWRLADGRLDATIDLPQLTASVNDFALQAGATLFRASTDGGNFAITGFAGGSPGRFVVVVNVSGGQITLTDQGAGSAAANRIITTSGVGDVLTVPDAAIMIYDGVSSRWRVLVRTA